MEDLTLRLESRPFGRAAFPQVFHNALDSAALRPQPLGKRRAFSTAAPAAMTTNGILRLNSKGGAEARPPTAQRGHFINTGSLSALNTKCPLSLGIGVPFRRYPHTTAQRQSFVCIALPHKGMLPASSSGIAPGQSAFALRVDRRGEGDLPPAVWASSRSTGVSPEGRTEVERDESRSTRCWGSSTLERSCPEKTSRRAFLMEIDPLYCDVIVRRWEEFTGRKAERVTTASESKENGQ